MSFWQRVFAFMKARPVATAMALAFVLALPSLGCGIIMDDVLQVLSVRPGNHAGLLPPRAAWDLFLFLRPGDPAGWSTAKFAEQGFVPWFADPNLQLTFLRPLASLTHALDYGPLGARPWLAHLHSVAWYALAAGAVARLHLKTFGSGALATLAAILWAIDDAHGLPVGWLSHRNAVIATAFAALSLHEYLRAVETRKGRHVLFSLGFFALALASAEVGIALLGYFVAHALLDDSVRWTNRVARFLPFVLLVVAWRVVYSALGYGAGGSGFYIDPASDPLRFLSVVPIRVAMMTIGQLAVPPSELMMIPGISALAFAFPGAILVFFILKNAAPFLRENKDLAWLALGALLSLIPACSAWPNDRMLLIPGLGAMPLLAALVLEAKQRWFRWTLIGIHVVLATLLFPLRAVSYDLLFGRPQERGAETLPSPAEMNDRTLVVVSAPSFLLLNASVVRHAMDTGAQPSRMVILTQGYESARVTTLDAYTVELEPKNGFINDPLAVAARDPKNTFHKGETIKLRDAVVTVEDITADGRPARASFRFEQPLTDQKYKWVTWTKDGYAPFEVPPPGTTLVYEAPPPF